MCGIVVIIGPAGAMQTAAAQRRAATMVAALAHRGPDDDGLWRGGAVVLGHTRLAIIDIAGGAQPLAGPRGQVMVSNGENYAFVEQFAALAARQIFPPNRADFTPMLFAPDAMIAERIAALRGMYALGHYDGRVVTLARDACGIKPLYGALDPAGTTHAYASQPVALLDGGVVPRVLNEAVFAHILAHQYYPGADTVWQGITRFAPGRTRTIIPPSAPNAPAGRPAAGIAVHDRRPPVVAAPRFDTYRTARAAVRTALWDSVRVHMRADVGYGLFLSGGIDSALLLAAMTQQSATPVHSLTAHFDTRAVADESALATELARRCGTHHHNVRVSRRDFFAHLPRIVAAFDDPVADYAAVPLWFLAARARAEGLKTVLSGEGGDEVFAGYARYRNRRWWWRRRAGRAIESNLFRISAGRLSSLRTDAARHPDVVPNWLRPHSEMQRRQAADIATWLPHDLLLKLDSMLMAHGIEGRTPFLDAAVLPFFYLPDRWKVRRRGWHRLGKWILRDILHTELPAARAFSRKRGFSVPVGAWLAPSGEDLAAVIPHILAPFVEPAATRAFLRARVATHPQLAWNLVFGALWHQIHIGGVAPEGGILAVLNSPAPGR